MRVIRARGFLVGLLAACGSDSTPSPTPPTPVSATPTTTPSAPTDAATTRPSTVATTAAIVVGTYQMCELDHDSGQWLVLACIDADGTWHGGTACRSLVAGPFQSWPIGARIRSEAEWKRGDWSLSGTEVRLEGWLDHGSAGRMPIAKLDASTNLASFRLIVQGSPVGKIVEPAAKPAAATVANALRAQFASRFERLARGDTVAAPLEWAPPELGHTTIEALGEADVDADGAVDALVAVEGQITGTLSSYKTALFLRRGSAFDFVADGKGSSIQLRAIVTLSKRPLLVFENDGEMTGSPTYLSAMQWTGDKLEIVGTICCIRPHGADTGEFTTDGMRGGDECPR